MSEHIVLVEKLSDWRPEFPGAVVVKAEEYLAGKDFLKRRNIKVINLCRSYSYLSLGYYCSLLAEARRHKVIPSVRTLTDLRSKPIYSITIEDLDDTMQKVLSKSQQLNGTAQYELRVFFGRCSENDPALQEIARQLYDYIRCPLLKIELKRTGRWQIEAIKPYHINKLAKEEQEFFVETFQGHLSKPWRQPKAPSTSRYDLAILHNPDEKLVPSNKKALERFIKVGKKIDINVELIGRKDYGRLAEYDALFIRETTNIDHYTYRFARKAANEGMVVIDDPDSIVRCTNKIFLAELLSTNNVPAPKTVAITGDNRLSSVDVLGYPVVLKIPDGSFSRGVFKAENASQYLEMSEKLLKESDLILAQEYVYTGFDWRIGILNRRPLYACQYFMSKHHWQIVKHSSGGRMEQGTAKTWRIEDVPPDVVKAALSAAMPIGDGLYGVDVKQTDKGIYVIEVNDNPNLDAGVEDNVLGDDLYRIILQEFVRRIENKRNR